MNRMGWDFPDAEEAKHMVNAVGIEIFSHFREAAFPPRITILAHLTPVVGWETPVLTVHGEGVGRSTGLRLHVEVVGLAPGFHAVAADADWNVAFDDHTAGFGVVVNVGQLKVKLVLDVIVQCHTLEMFAARSAQAADFRFVVSLVFGPYPEIRSAVRVAQITEGGVRHEP